VGPAIEPSTALTIHQTSSFFGINPFYIVKAPLVVSASPNSAAQLAESFHAEMKVAASTPLDGAASSGRVLPDYSLSAPTVSKNVLRILRAMQLPRAILLEVN